MTGTAQARTWTVSLVLLVTLALTGCRPFPGIEIGNAGTEPIVVDVVVINPSVHEPEFFGGDRFVVRGVLELEDGYYWPRGEDLCHQPQELPLVLRILTESQEPLFERNLDDEPVCDGERYVWTGNDFVQLEPGDDLPPLLDPDEVGQVIFEPE